MGHGRVIGIGADKRVITTVVKFKLKPFKKPNKIYTPTL